MHVSQSKKFRQIFTSSTYLLRVPVEVQVHHDIPWVITADGTTQAQHLPSKHPPQGANGHLTLETNTMLTHPFTFCVRNTKIIFINCLYMVLLSIVLHVLKACWVILGFP